MLNFLLSILSLHLCQAGAISQRSRSNMLHGKVQEFLYFRKCYALSHFTVTYPSRGELTSLCWASCNHGHS